MIAAPITEIRMMHRNDLIYIERVEWGGIEMQLYNKKDEDGYMYIIYTHYHFHHFHFSN